jgi:hypothetical protein
MIRWALRRANDTLERNLNTDASYVRDMVLVVHDHVSVPIDPQHGQAFLNLTP